MNDLTQVLQLARDEHRLALFPYLTAGYPDKRVCEALLVEAASSGADGLEIGIPFSDPLADGVTLQKASQAALERGATLEMALGIAERVHARTGVPIVMMSYANPLFAFGIERLAERAAASGVEGLIVPDVPPEESASIRAACQAQGIHYVYMLAPTSTDERIRLVASMAKGFVYCVALVGVTGARASVSTDLGALLARIRSHTDLPLLVGFGVSSPEHVRAIRASGADAVVVASALVDLVDRTEPSERRAAVGAFVRSLREAAEGGVPA